MAYTAHVDTFARDNLPPPDELPEVFFDLPELRYPARMNCAVELLDNGVPLDRQSYLGQLAQVKGGGLERYWEESEAYRCRGGSDRLARALAAAIGSENLRLGTPVTAIQGSVVVIAEFSDGLICVQVAPPSIERQTPLAYDVE